MSKPTKADAELFLQIFAIMRSDEELKKASRWVSEELDVQNYNEFKSKHPKGSEGDRNIRTFAMYGELVGLLVNRDLLSEDLVFDLAGDFTWNKVGPILQGMRKDLERPRLWENYEFLAKKFPKWAEKNPPKV